MNREELIALVNNIRFAKGTEEEIDQMLNLFLGNVPDPNAADYIFGVEHENLTSEEIVDKALNYKPFNI